MKITNINQLLPLIKDKAEFVVIDKGDYTVIDYVYQDKDTFDKPELMECRGIKFDKDGLILARPFRKFFNYGEQGSDLPAHRPHVITEKVDGSMIHPTSFPGGVTIFMTRKGYTDVAKKAERHILNSSGIEYLKFCSNLMTDGWTPIFEYVGPDNRIVLRYDEPSLILLACRHTIEGTLMSYDTLRGAANQYKVPLVKKKNFQLKGQTDEFIKHTRELKDAEGYVVYFDDGYMVKIKAEEYVMKHRALDDLGSKKKVVALCVQGFHDDVLPMLDEKDAAELVEFNDAVQEQINANVDAADTTAKLITKDIMSRKEFALNIAPRITPKWLSGVVFGVVDGKDARLLVRKAFEKNFDDIEAKWRGQ